MDRMIAERHAIAQLCVERLQLQVAQVPVRQVARNAEDRVTRLVPAGIADEARRHPAAVLLVADARAEILAAFVRSIPPLVPGPVRQVVGLVPDRHEVHRAGERSTGLRDDPQMPALTEFLVGPIPLLLPPVDPALPRQVLRVADGQGRESRLPIDVRQVDVGRSVTGLAHPGDPRVEGPLVGPGEGGRGTRRSVRILGVGGESEVQHRVGGDDGSPRQERIATRSEADRHGDPLPAVRDRNGLAVVDDLPVEPDADSTNGVDGQGGLAVPGGIHPRQRGGLRRVAGREGGSEVDPAIEAGECGGPSNGGVDGGLRRDGAGRVNVGRCVELAPGRERACDPPGAFEEGLEVVGRQRGSAGEGTFGLFEPAGAGQEMAQLDPGPGLLAEPGICDGGLEVSPCRVVQAHRGADRAGGEPGLVVLRGRGASDRAPRLAPQGQERGQVVTRRSPQRALAQATDGSLAATPQRPVVGAVEPAEGLIAAVARGVRQGQDRPGGGLVREPGPGGLFGRGA